LDPQWFIAKPSKGLVNSAKGVWAEKQVQAFLLKKGFQILHSRWKTPFAEVDLVAQKNKKYYFFEVKTLLSMDYKPQRISKKQRLRLERAYQWALQFYFPLEMWLVFVAIDGKIKSKTPKNEQKMPQIEPQIEMVFWDGI
jgi:Holliday junction resolvase-like predicted endonuclease